LPSPELVDVICSTGPDFVVIDSEHAPLTLETAQLIAMVCSSRQVSPVFRVPGARSDRIVPALEIGSHGIQAPNISAAKDADFLLNLQGIFQAAQKDSLLILELVIIRLNSQAE